MKILADGSEQVRESLVGFLVGGHDTDLGRRHLNATLDAHLDIASPTRRLLLHVRPDVSAQVPLEQGVTRFVKLRVSDDWDTLWERARHLDSILVKLLLCH